MINKKILDNFVGSGKAIKAISKLQDLFVDVLWEYENSKNYAEFGKKVEQLLIDVGYVEK